MAWAAFVVSLLGAVAIYLAAPHQAWLAKAWPVRMRWAGIGLLLIALALWLETLRPLAAVFTFSTLLMLLFTVLPYLGALRRVLRRQPAGDRHG
ncbi:MAG TPA: hypothetical protein H9903_05595 [Candidatus Aquabacterium excrementipullorum]|nr:hypothetical protein [Candidatus Aquabacterium excrementipullorum]